MIFPWNRTCSKIRCKHVALVNSPYCVNCRIKELKNKKLSIIIPVYNEEDTILQVLKLVSCIKLPLNMKKEVIIVNDGSTDNTRAVVQKYIIANPKKGANITFITKGNNGKGSAVIRGISLCTGDIIIIQDADLELDPNEISSLITPILYGYADVVYGSRFSKGKHKKQKVSFYLGGWAVTQIANLLYSTKLTDTSTCYKVFRSSILKSCILTEPSFGFDPEVTSIIARWGINITEIPISYAPRDKEHGKKIRWVDGVKAMWILFRNRFKSLELLIK